MKADFDAQIDVVGEIDFALPISSSADSDGGAQIAKIVDRKRAFPSKRRSDRGSPHVL